MERTVGRTLPVCTPHCIAHVTMESEIAVVVGYLDLGTSQPSPPGVALRLAIMFVAAIRMTITVVITTAIEVVRRRRCGGGGGGSSSRVVVFTTTAWHLHHWWCPHLISGLLRMRRCHHRPMGRRTSRDTLSLMRSLRFFQRGLVSLAVVLFI